MNKFHKGPAGLKVIGFIFSNERAFPAVQYPTISSSRTISDPPLTSTLGVSDEKVQLAVKNTSHLARPTFTFQT